MFSFRGDAHKFYLKLKEIKNSGETIGDIAEVSEINHIQKFYEQLSHGELKNIRYWMLKEKDGNGMIPVLVSVFPWLGFLLSDQLQSLVSTSHWFLFLFLVFYTGGTTLSVLLHYREKSWATMHIEIIDDLLNDNQPESKN